ncbi:TIGR00730 family Rossman fold protein [Pseudothauera nasutitermitis]|uniref:Cytokinin riboside 5'-monophosphate phosphoribohydrolase n=1 Tax=Pseudothauera nasutitermitis TaxID=2565930 RepID=A0A4S4ASH6_9RHOO|nr:TIGR00730 family Rossman fold protein [Pseudothauera nasutitermitis]THF62787.1 TIGR00730 family Rossman fold protein [Pseudothauera nasutitermitis]
MTQTESPAPFRSLCVYCGSANGRLDDYAGAARALAAAMVERGIRLVYGGASVGIMGAVADEVLRLGGEAVGVIPESLMRKELAHAKLTELHVTPSMHARKTLMAELADGFVALPGGIGTFEELFEVWTWGQLGFHRKPCGLLNVAGYYDGLTGFLDHAAQEQFVRAEHRAMLVVESDPVRLLERYAAYQPPALAKWVERGQT